MILCTKTVCELPPCTAKNTVSQRIYMGQKFEDTTSHGGTLIEGDADWLLE